MLMTIIHLRSLSKCGSKKCLDSPEIQWPKLPSGYCRVHVQDSIEDWAYRRTHLAAYFGLYFSFQILFVAVSLALHDIDSLRHAIACSFCSELDQ